MCEWVGSAIRLCGLVLGLLVQGVAPAQVTIENAEPAPVAGIPEGYYLFEEDILLPVGESMERATYTTALWPGGVIPFEFDPNVGAINQQFILNFMAAWEAVANVDFVVRNGEADFLHIQFAAFNACEGVGMDGGRQDIWINSMQNFGTVAHELGHALGFWHEQSRADRDAFVQINWDNILQNGCVDAAGNPASCDSQFELRGEGGEYGPYDFDSIMHYGACGFSCCAREAQCSIVLCAPSSQACRTITVLPPFDVTWQNNIGQRTHLSVFDQLTMSFLYPQPDWRFVEQGAGGSDSGTFQNPYRTWSRAMSETPTSGTLWFLEPDHYSAVGTYSSPMIWRAGYGTVTLGD